MEADENEIKLMRAAALQNARTIRLIRERAEQEILQAKEALEWKTVELAHSLAMMQATLESATDGILVTDDTGKVTCFNRNFLEMWQIPREIMDSMEHRRVLEAICRQFSDPGAFLDRVVEIDASSPPETFDLLEMADGRVIERYSKIQRIEQRNVGRVWSFRDVTERKRADEALRAAQEKLSRHAEELERKVEQRTAHLNESIQSLEGVCYTIAHDLRAPLRAVQGFTKILLEDYAPHFDFSGRQLAQRIVTSAVRMDTLIQDLLDYARLSHLELPCANIELESALENCLQNLAQEIEAKQARLSVQPLPPVWANQLLLDQILTNLLSNALKFVHPGIAPHIQVWSEPNPPFVRLFIQDNGLGISPEHHEQVFGIFHRLHSDEKQFPGTGVGLAVVRKGMERMGGQVGIKPEVTSGTCFYLDFHPAKESENQLPRMDERVIASGRESHGGLAGSI
jgi:PAS domain S-box-containing protein